MLVGISFCVLLIGLCSFCQLNYMRQARSFDKVLTGMNVQV